MHFPHLRVASAYSAHYGVARPQELAQVAASYGAQALACTDRDGLYGAVKHVLACQQHGVAPVLGVDLALLGPVAASAGKRARAAAGPQGQNGRPGRGTVPPARVI
uniref:PHP domain-containing protein n=1 Tax=Kocuria atrinae TaxID=592377 RepID=UPI0004CEBFD9